MIKNPFLVCLALKTTEPMLLSSVEMMSISCSSSSELRSITSSCGICPQFAPHKLFGEREGEGVLVIVGVIVLVAVSVGAGGAICPIDFVAEGVCETGEREIETVMEEGVVWEGGLVSVTGLDAVLVGDTVSVVVIVEVHDLLGVTDPEGVLVPEGV